MQHRTVDLSYTSPRTLSCMWLFRFYHHPSLTVSVIGIKYNLFLVFFYNIQMQNPIISISYTHITDNYIPLIYTGNVFDENLCFMLILAIFVMSSSLSPSPSGAFARRSAYSPRRLFRKGSVSSVWKEVISESSYVNQSNGCKLYWRK